MTTTAMATVPVVLLKTRSAPHDDYATLFSRPPFASATFVPVLAHASDLAPLHALLASLPAFPYGGLIFTSQRAVEALAQALEPDSTTTTPPPPSLATLRVPLYAVGPATARALTSLRDAFLPGCSVEGGARTGTGEELARYIADAYRGGDVPLLFLTGERRRDVVRTVLAERGIAVREEVVYATCEMDGFASHLARALEGVGGRAWVVVFSPTGCAAMLAVLGWLDERTGRARDEVGRRGRGRGKEKGVWVASIGPTTRDYLRAEFGFEVDVCAARPSAEGLGEGIRAFMEGDMGGGGAG